MKESSEVWNFDGTGIAKDYIYWSVLEERVDGKN